MMIDARDEIRQVEAEARRWASLARERESDDWARVEELADERCDSCGEPLSGCVCDTLMPGLRDGGDRRWSRGAIR